MMSSFSSAIIYLAKNIAKPIVIWETLQKCKKLSEKTFFSAPRASVWFKNKETAWVPRVPSLEPPLDSKVSQQF